MSDRIKKPNKPIMGKVAGVLTERELTINIGSKDCVCVDMKFKILASSPFEVKDPDTQEVLGTVDREKVRVKAIAVFEKYSICKTFRKIITAGLSVPDISSLLRFQRTIPETLKAEDSTLPPPLSEAESFVKKGDRVVQLIEDD